MEPCRIASYEPQKLVIPSIFTGAVVRVAINQPVVGVWIGITLELPVLDVVIVMRATFEATMFGFPTLNLV